MLELVEEFEVGSTVCIVVDTFKDFIYAEYDVVKNEFKGIKNHHVELHLKHAYKKERYFRDIITFDGFRIEFRHTNTKFEIYGDLTDALKAFCKKLKKNPEKNIKLEKKFKHKYPNYFY
jgi:hypothetical protein